MAERFVTSDLHFFHKNVIKYCDRPWTFEEQTNEIISRWNSRVGLMDDVFHLGDFAFANHKQVNQVVDIIKELNGKIHFLRGNHCDNRLWNEIENRGLAHVQWIKDYHEFRDSERRKIVMCHYPMAIWNSSHHGAWMLHGHCHGSYQGAGRILDCGIDNHPEHQVFSWDEITEFMSGREFASVDHHKEGRE